MTAILWEHHSVGVIARLDSVCVSILQWEGSIVTSVVTCSMASTPDWAGNATIQSHTHRATLISRHSSRCLQVSVKQFID